jgi:hypothetical protein
VLDHASKLRPELAPRVGLEVEGIDVLVLLRRVLGVLDRPVGSPAEPFRVLAGVRVVGCGLEGDVERDLEAVLVRTGDEAPEVVEIAQLRVDRCVPAFGRADRPGAARIVRVGARGVVRSLPEASTDRVDRGQVEDVERHLGDLGQARLDVGERAVAVRLGRRRAREHLVPGTEPRKLAIDHDRELRLEDRREASLCVAMHEVGQLRREGCCGGADPASPDRGGEVMQPGGVISRRPTRRLFHEHSTDDEVCREVLSGADPLLEVVRPRRETIDPCHDRVAIPADLGRREAGSPSVIDERLHARLEPVGVCLAPVEEDAGDRIVPVGVGDRFDDQHVTDDPLDREGASIDVRRHPRDDDPASAVPENGDRRRVSHGRASDTDRASAPRSPPS